MGRIITLPNVLVVLGATAFIGGLSARVCFIEQAATARRLASPYGESSRVNYGRHERASREFRDIEISAKVNEFCTLLVASLGCVFLLAGGILKLTQRLTDRGAADDDVPAEWLE